MSASDLRDVTRRLVGAGGAASEALKPAPVKGAKPGGVATGRPSSGGAGNGAMVETAFEDREYWGSVDFTSSDGLFTIQVDPIKKVVLEGGRSIEFKEPT